MVLGLIVMACMIFLRQGIVPALAAALAHVPAKWTPVRRQEHAPIKESRACSDSKGTEHAPGRSK